MRVYIAGPYSSNPEKCTEEAILIGDWVRALGHTPYIPHLTHFWEKQIHHDYEYWLALDLEWLAVCDALLRLPGESSGADKEVAWAEEHGIPVYHSVLELFGRRV